MKTSKTHYYKLYISLLRDYYNKELSLAEIKDILGPDYNYWKAHYLDYEESMNSIQKQLDTALAEAKIKLFEYSFRKKVLQIQAEGLKFVVEEFNRFQAGDMNYGERLGFAIRIKKGIFQAQFGNYIKNQNELAELASNFKRDFGLLFRF